MQKVIELVVATKEQFSKREDFKDFDYKLSFSAVIELLETSYYMEMDALSEAFDRGFLQAELKQKAEVTSGHEYVKKNFKGNENISSKV